MKHITHVTTGYIVIGGYQAMQLGHYDDTPKAGVLQRGDWATVFRTRRLAHNAIKRSKAYSESRRLNWDTRFRIQRLGTPS